MLHITYNVDSATDLLSSGHILWNVFSTFVISFFIECKVIPHESWKRSSIITYDAFLNHTDKKLNKYDKHVYIDKYKKWESINFSDLNDIIKTIKNIKKKYNNICVIFSNVCNIHPDIVYKWYKLKKIPNDIYSLKLIPYIKNLYYYDHKRDKIDAFAIHMRRGDLCKWTYDEGFTIDYYKNIINHINKKMNIPINIYTESTGKGTTTQLDIRKDERKTINYDDIDELSIIKNVNIYKGDLNDFTLHFNELCRSKYLLCSPSSFCLWASFLSNNKIYIDDKCRICRPNCFRNINIIPNFIVYNKFVDIENF